MSGARRTALVLWLVGPAFAGVAAYLALASPTAPIPVADMKIIPRDAIRPGPWRTPVVAPVGVVGGEKRPCAECHRLFTTPPGENKTLFQHKNIVMNHGMNTRCLNCHDGDDRDKLVLHDGTLVDFADTPRLCSQCHGTVYRDWQRGMHGKTMGSWDASSGKQRRLTCNECHEPHAPAYKPMKPLPNPETLRMGDQRHEEDAHEKRSPLRQWSTPSHLDPADAAHRTVTPSEHPKEAPADGKPGADGGKGNGTGGGR